MFYEDTNFTVQTGNLTRDVEIRTSPGGTVVANIRIGVNGRRKVGEEWVDKPNFFTVVTFGKQAENDAKYLKKGRRILVEGRLDWSEWPVEGEENKRQGVQIIASRVQYLPTRASIEAQAATEAQTAMAEAEQPAGEPQATSEPEHAAGGPSETAEPVGVGSGEGEQPPF